MMLAMLGHLLLALPLASPVVDAGQDAAGDCAATLCLVRDFIDVRNPPVPSADRLEAAYGAFILDDVYGLRSAGVEPCDVAPASACFRRLITLRQKIYPSVGTKKDVGCLIVGGISRRDDVFRSYGVMYQRWGGSWQPVGIHHYVSLKDVPTAGDVFRDPCTPAGE